MTVTVFEQIEQLIEDGKKAKMDLETTDLDYLDSPQLKELAEVCSLLIPTCIKIAKEIDVVESEKNN
ncbi:hypothetical protein MZM54_02185 [[Brevibacterium] frigoritolerans]|nr:hypothetical protein [Peribacillus frigoritolerans]